MWGKPLAIMLAIDTGKGVALEGNLGECISHTPLPSANKATHSGFETQRRRHQKSKTGVSMTPQKGLMSSKNLKKMILMKVIRSIELNLRIKTKFITKVLRLSW